MCEEYRLLFDACQNADSQYTHVVAMLARLPRMSNQRSAFFRACEKARIDLEQARIALDSHIAAHGCMKRAGTAQ